MQRHDLKSLSEKTAIYYMILLVRHAGKGKTLGSETR